MGFLQARSDRDFSINFRDAVFALWNYENQASDALKSSGFHAVSRNDIQNAIASKAAKLEGYGEVRERVAKGILRETRLARRLGVAYEFTSFPAPAVGGPVIPVNLFQAILLDTSHGGISRRVLHDTLDQVVGAAEDQAKLEKRRLFNPFNWIKELIVAIIRIPFMLIDASGFDVHKIEDHLFARLFKLAEIVILVWLSIYFLGLTKEELLNLLKFVKIL